MFESFSSFEFVVCSTTIVTTTIYYCDYFNFLLILLKFDCLYYSYLKSKEVIMIFIFSYYSRAIPVSSANL